MDFLSTAQEQTYHKIKPWIAELFPASQALADMPVFQLAIGSTFAFIQVAPWKEDATITARAYVVSGAEASHELLLYLLRENDTKRFGAFGIDESGDIVFQHAIVGSTVDKAELKATVASVLQTADQYDDLIIESYGGKRGLEIMSEA